MISYSRFLTRNILIKKGLYITIALFTILMIVITYVQAADANKMNRPFINTITTFTKFFPFLISSLFTTLITVYVFKDGEDDGSELMVVSKAITRKVIVSSKFLVTLAFIIGFHAFAFIIYLISGVTDKVATTKMILEFAGSLTVGGFMIQLIVLSIVTLLASVVGKVGTLMSGTLLAAVIPILSFILSPISNGLPVGTRFLRERMFINANVVDDVDPTKLTEEQAVSMIDYENIYNTRANANNSAKENEEAKYNDYISNLWYQPISYFDIWYQWGRFMNMFNNDLSTKLTAVQKWNKVDIDKHYPPNSTFRVGLKPNGQEQASVDYKDVVMYLNTEEMGLDGEHGYASGVSQAFITLRKDLESLGNKGYISSDVFNAPYPDAKESNLRTQATVARNAAAAATTAGNTTEAKRQLDIAKALDTQANEAAKEYALTDSEKKTLKTLKNVVTSPYLSSKIENLHLGQKNLGLLVRIKAYREINNFLKLNGYTLTNEMGVFDEDQIRTPYVFPEKIMSPGSTTQWIFDADKPLPIYQPSPFIKTNTIIYTWLGIMGVLMGTTVFIYSRRDFK